MSTAISLYKPENGPTLQVLGGWHLGDYVSIQGTYVWNRNRLTLTSSQASPGGVAFYDQDRTASQHTVVGELMLFFRDRVSWARPYLSVGGGVVRLQSGVGDISHTRTMSLSAPTTVTATGPALRVAVGIDVLRRDGWAFRFTFSETIATNSISAVLMPPGERNLANFQNFFGLTKHF